MSAVSGLTRRLVLAGLFAALVTPTLCFATGTGSIFAFPGRPFGALTTGPAYLAIRREAAALIEPLGTIFIGATLAALVFAPVVGLSGAAGGFVVFAGSFALSSPGAILGYLLLRALRNSGVLG